MGILDKVSKVADSINNQQEKPSKQKTIKPGKVVDDNSEGHHVLDDLKTEPVQQKVRTKLVIMDDAQINDIMKSTDAEYRRKALAKLTPAQRRRVMDRYQQISKVQDGAEPNKIDYINLATVLQNYIVSPSEYNADALELQVTTYNFPPSVQDLVTALFTGDDPIQFAADVDNVIHEHGAESNIRETLEALIDGNSDSTEPEDYVMTDEDKSQFSDSVKTAFIGITNPRLIAAKYDEISAPYLAKGCKIEELNSITDSVMSELAEQKIRDEVVDDLANLQPKDEDGNEIQPEGGESLLDKLTEALESYSNGDTTKLEALADLDENGNKSEGEEGEDNKPEEDTSIPMSDCKKLANAVLKGNNQVIDSFYNQVPQLKKRNYFKVVKKDAPKVSDSAPYSVPKNYDEYCSAYKTPQYIYRIADILAQHHYPNGLSNPSNVEVDELGNVLASFGDLNDGGFQVYMKPITSVEGPLDMGTPQEVVANCVPYNCFMEAAAITNNLHEIDPLYYQQTENGPWCFDQCPEDVAEYCDWKGIEHPESGSITPCDKIDESEQMFVWGQPYHLS